MLTVRKLGLAQASTYYSKDNYYTKEKGEFYGKLKGELGLSELTHDDFVKLLDGVNPTTGEQLVHSKSGKENQVPAFDFTFSPSKSISIAYELALAKGDTELLNRLTKAHDNAVNEALSHIEETEIKARVQKNKVRKSVTTGNMIAAKFQHDINRNLEPQIHTHSVLFNFTKVNDKYRALDAQDLLKKKSPIIKNLGQFYRQSLKAELEKAGFELRDVDKKESFYELKVVDEELIKTFSSRSRSIKNKIKELKKEFPTLTNSQLSLRAFFNTRVTKKGVNREEVAVKNLETIDKLVDSDKLLKQLKQVNSKPQIQQINHDEVFKIIKEVKTELNKSKYKSLKTPLNTAIETFKKIEDKDVSIKNIHEHVKVQEELQPLITMHDIVQSQLQKTKFSLKKTNTIDKNVNIDKLVQEEILENVKLKRTNGKEITTRFVKNFDRESRITKPTIKPIEREFRDFDRAATTERIRARFGGTQSQGFNDDSNRNVGKDRTKDRRITIDDLRRMTEIAKSQNQNKEISL